VVRSHGVSLDPLVGAAEQGRNVQPPCLVSFELEIKIAQLARISMTFDHHAVLQLAAPLPCGER
jgi:hypothetical protein